MDIGLLHRMCKEDTRTSFEDFKNSLSIGLFDFNDNVKEDLQTQLKQGLCKRTIKYFVTEYNPSEIQIKYLMNVVNDYNKLVLRVSENYCKSKAN
jgi:hypothetical protein